MHTVVYPFGDIRARGLTGRPLHSTSRFPVSTGAVHKSMTFGCMFMLVQLNKRVVCVVLICKGGIVVMGGFLRQFCLHMRVVGDICLF